MWSRRESQASSGEGGAISSSGPIAMTITDTIFRTNDAPRGSALSIAAAVSVRSANSGVACTVQSSLSPRLGFDDSPEI